jgi:hypothetical protein
MRVLAVSALTVGALIRIAILPIGASAVDDSWRAWSYHAATRGPWNLYGPRGHTVSFAGIDAPVVYPPLALDEFAIIGRAHMALNGGRFDNDVALTRTIKGAIVLLDGMLTALIFLVVRRAGGAASAWWAGMAYWLNPAVLMITTLGYVDVFLAIPAVGALIAASYGRPWLTGILFAAGIMTKPQGLFIAPAAALALWNAGHGESGMRRLCEAAAASAMAAALIAAPVVAVGKTYDMLRSVAVLAGHDALSALAFNLWWIVSYLFTAAAARAGGLHAALLVHTDIVTHAYAMERGWPHPRVVAILLLAASVLWALKTAVRARDLGLHAALAAFIVFTYFTLSVQVHENHFFLALPLLAIAAALRRAFAPVLAAVSVSFALNLYVIFGVRGDGPPAFVTTLTRIDPSVLLSVINCALFGWMAAVFARACGQAADERGGCAKMALHEER